MTGPTVVRAEHLSCDYGEFRAVRDVSLHLAAGEVYALLGTNGAGKTTILETIQGHRPIDEGSVTVFGFRPGDRRRVRPRCGIMLQESGFADDLSTLKTLTHFGRLSGRSDDSERLLEKVGLTARAGVRVAHLSGGEKRRLDFALAIHGGPDLLFLDEPTLGMDPEARSRVWRIIAELRDNGTAVLLTTHNLTEAEQNADRIGLLHGGVMTREGTLEELTASLPTLISFRVDGRRDGLPLHLVWEGDRARLNTTTAQRDLLVLLRMELTMMVRNRMVLAAAVVVPLAFVLVALAALTAWPLSWGAVVMGALLTQLGMVVLAVATSSVTRLPEHAQITTVPGFLAISGLATWVAFTPQSTYTWPKRLALAARHWS